MNACPTCGSVSSLELLVDAWIRYKIRGLHSGGELDLSDQVEIQEFDHQVVECCSCGASFTTREIERVLTNPFAKHSMPATVPMF